MQFLLAVFKRFYTPRLIRVIQASDETGPKDRLPLLIVLLSLWACVVAFAGLAEYRLLEADAAAVRDFAKINLIFGAGVLPYVIGMTSWLLLFLISGWIWCRFLFPDRDLFERIIIGLCGAVVTAFLGLAIPLVSAFGAHLFGHFFGAEFSSFVIRISLEWLFLSANNHEQIYELTTALLILAVGILGTISRYLRSKDL